MSTMPAIRTTEADRFRRKRQNALLRLANLSTRFVEGFWIAGMLIFPVAQSVGARDGHTNLPYQCATCVGEVLADRQESTELESSDDFTVASNVQYAEIIPGVIRENGSETFRIYLHLGREVNRVYMSSIAYYFSPSSTELLDDGNDGDLVAGDRIYTSGRFQMTVSSPFPLTYISHADLSLVGMDYIDIGTLNIEETDGSESSFLILPEVGVLEPDIPTTQTEAVSSDIQMASHLVNIRRTGAPAAQNYLHYLGGDYTALLQNLTQNIYSAIPDQYDFMVVMSAMHGELIPLTSSPNFNVGMHIKVRNSVSGINDGTFDIGVSYGSSNRLLSINLLDSAQRGNYINNVLHEITHQWSAFLSEGLGIKYDSDHWSSRSSTGSILGGYAWNMQADGSWMLDSDQCRYRLSHMAPLDLYLAGLLPADEVPVTMAYDPSSKNVYARLRDGDPILPEEVTATVTIDDIIALHGERSPQPLEAQHHFNVLFVVESIDRLLTPDEMTFYNRLARDFERTLAPGEPDPILTYNWMPATRYFASSATLSSRVTGWDSDNDTLYDDWEITYFSNLVQNGDGDPDNDGLSNFAEQAYLTNPNQPDKQPPIRVYQTDEYVKFEYTAFVPTLDYSLEITPELGTPSEWSSPGMPSYTNGPHCRVHLSRDGIASGLLPPALFGRGTVEPPPSVLSLN